MALWRSRVRIPYAPFFLFLLHTIHHGYGLFAVLLLLNNRSPVHTSVHHMQIRLPCPVMQPWRLSPLFAMFRLLSYNFSSYLCLREAFMRKSSGKLAILLLSAAMAAVPCVSAQASSLTAVMNAHKDEIITECRKYGIWRQFPVRTG